MGRQKKPFLDYLLQNIAGAGYTEIVIVINDRDTITAEYYSSNPINGLQITFAIQKIPQGRNKPLGTAYAVLQGLESKPNWSGLYFTVCNADNLYSINALALLREKEQGIIDYDAAGLGIPEERVKAFAVIRKDRDGYLTDIIEKPTNTEIALLTDNEGRVGVSMNIFRLNEKIIKPYLENCPLDPQRNEKELPMAIKMMIQDCPQSMQTTPLSEKVPDLTYKWDIPTVSKGL